MKPKEIELGPNGLPAGLQRVPIVEEWADPSRLAQLQSGAKCIDEWDVYVSAYRRFRAAVREWADARDDPRAAFVKASPRRPVWKGARGGSPASKNNAR